MSKTSSKQRYTQLMEWLSTRPKPQRKNEVDRDDVDVTTTSRMDYYNLKGYDNMK